MGKIWIRFQPSKFHIEEKFMFKKECIEPMVRLSHGFSLRVSQKLLFAFIPSILQLWMGCSTNNQKHIDNSVDLCPHQKKKKRIIFEVIWKIELELCKGHPESYFLESFVERIEAKLHINLGLGWSSVLRDRRWGGLKKDCALCQVL